MTHLTRNKRLLDAQSGFGFRIFNARYGEWLASVESVESGIVVARVMAPLRAPPPEARAPVNLLLAPTTQQQRLRFAYEKATELGVVAIRPVRSALGSERGLALASSPEASAWCRNAVEQSERLSMPSVSLEPASLLAVCREAHARGERLFLCAEPSAGGSRPPLLQALDDDERRGYGTKAANFLIGPEAGWSSRELDETLAAVPSITCISLGDGVLRAETAAVCALSIWRGHSDRFDVGAL